MLILLLTAFNMVNVNGDETAKADEISLQLDRPLEREVFQRNHVENAYVIISGSVPKAATIVEAKADLRGSGKRGEMVPWTEVSKGPFQNGKFRGTLRLATGGWYQLSVRFRKTADNPAVLGEAKIERVGVGDVYITAGQSNSINFGRPKQKSTEDLSVYFDGKQFMPAADPMPDAIGEGGTPWPLLGDMLSRTTRAPVCFRSATTNYTRIKEWVPFPESIHRVGQIERLVERARWFGPGGIRAVLWVQGEADADDPGQLKPTPLADYERDATAMIEFSRKQLGWKLDWFVAGNSYIPSKPGKDYKNSIADILGAQKALWDKGIAFPGPYTNDLVGNTDYRHDGVHFGPRGLQVHAERWFVVLCSRYSLANPVASQAQAHLTKALAPDKNLTMEALTPPSGVKQASYPFPKLDWVDTVRRKNAEASHKASAIQLVFDGDSITSWFANYSGPGNSGVEIWKERYAKLGAFDFGIPGDSTQHLLWRLANGQMNGIHPKLILLLIGTNNLGLNTDEEIIEGIEAIVNQYRKLCPNAVILLQGIFPRERLASNPIRSRIKAINKKIATFANGKSVIFMDLGDKFLQPDGSITTEIMRDYLHPNESGYRIWADAIQPYVDRFVISNRKGSP